MRSPRRQARSQRRSTRRDHLLDELGFDRMAGCARAAAITDRRDLPRLSTGRRLSLIWGVHCIVAEDAHDLDDMVERACRLACKDGFAKPGQRVIVVAGVPLGTPGATNMLRVAFVSAEAAKE